MVIGNLPDGWEWSTLNETCEIVLGQSPSSDTYNAEGIGLPFYQGKAEFGDLYPTPEKWCSSPKKIAEKDDILISVRAPVGPTNLCPEKSCIGRGLAAIRPKGFPTKYFLHYLRYIEKEWDSKATGTTFKAITGDVLRNQEIPVAPLPEQERIVSRIEELFSDLEAGAAALERVRAGLKRYKASVLKAAVGGRLVNGNLGIGEGELPEGWRRVNLGEVAEMRLGKMLDKEKNKGELKPYIRNINVRWFEFDLSDIQFMRVLDNELENISVRKGDLVVCEGGEPGRAAVWNKDEPVIIQKALHRVRLNDDVLPTYVLYCLSADAQTGQLEKYFTGSTIKHFTGQSLRTYKFPVPPLEEQRRIVAEVERRLSVVGEVESAVEAGLARAARLRQAVLRSAFEGML